VQLFSAAGKALGAPLRVDESPYGSVSDAITALGADRGYGITWIRGNRSGMWTRRLTSDGKLGAVARVGESQEGEVGDLAAAVLDDGRTILVWDLHNSPDSWSLRARFLDAAGAVVGEEIT